MSTQQHSTGCRVCRVNVHARTQDHRLYKTDPQGSVQLFPNISAMNCVFILPPPRVPLRVLPCGPRVHANRADALRHAPHMRTSNSLRQHHLMSRVPKMSRIMCTHSARPPATRGHACSCNVSFQCPSSVLPVIPMARGIQVSFQCPSSDTDGERHSSVIPVSFQ